MTKTLGNKPTGEFGATSFTVANGFRSGFGAAGAVAAPSSAAVAGMGAAAVVALCKACSAFVVTDISDTQQEEYKCRHIRHMDRQGQAAALHVRGKS